MAVTNPQDLVWAIPNNKIDQIVDIVTGSFTVAAGVTDGFGFVTPSTATDSKALQAGATLLLKGIWSYDNEVSWQEMGNSIPLGVSSNGLRVLTVDTNASTLSGLDQNSYAYINASNEGTSAYTINYQVLAMTRYDQPALTTKPLIQPLRYSSEIGRAHV